MTSESRVLGLRSSLCTRPSNVGSIINTDGSSLCDRHAPGKVEEGIDEALAQLGLDYLDLYLIHWPVASRPGGKNEIDFVDVNLPLPQYPDPFKVRIITLTPT